MDDDPTEKVGRHTKQCIAILYRHGFHMTKPRLISIKLHVIVSIPGDGGNYNEKECRRKSNLLTSQNIGNFLAKSTTLVIAGVMIFVKWLKASKSTFPPSGAFTIGACPMSSG